MWVGLLVWGFLQKNTIYNYAYKFKSIILTQEKLKKKSKVGVGLLGFLQKKYYNYGYKFKSIILTQENWKINIFEVICGKLYNLSC